MAARSSMAGLITRLRVMIDDVPATQTFTDDTLQGVLDMYRYRLAGVQTQTDIRRLVFASLYPNLETTTELRDASGTIVITPTSSNYDSGEFTFATLQAATPYVYGWAYDLYRVAADLWLMKAGATGQWKGQFVQYAQMQANFYLSRAWPDQSEVVRQAPSWFKYPVL